MRNIIGNPVSNGNFVGREDLLKEALSLLNQGNSIQIMGLRRTGKSSVLKELCRRIEKEEFGKVLFVDLQSTTSLPELIKTLADVLPDNLLGNFRKRLRVPKNFVDSLGIRKISALGVGIELKDNDVKSGVESYWENIKDAYATVVSSEENMFLFMDEISYLFENLLENGYTKFDIKKILGMFRAWRQSGISMIITGSVQLDSFIKSNDLPINLLSDLNNLYLEPLNEEEALVLLNGLAKNAGLSIDKATCKIFINTVQDKLPVIIQQFFQKAKHHLGDLFTKEGLENIYQTKVIPEIDRNFISQFEDRINDKSNFPEDEYQIIISIFKTLLNKSQVSFESLRKENNKITKDLLLRLKVQEFIKEDSKNIYSFSLNIIESWAKDYTV